MMVAWQWANGLLKRYSEFQVGIKPMTSVTLAGCSNHSAVYKRTHGELDRLTGFLCSWTIYAEELS